MHQKELLTKEMEWPATRDDLRSRVIVKCCKIYVN